MLKNFDETSTLINKWPELYDMTSAPNVPIGLDV